MERRYGQLEDSRQLKSKDTVSLGRIYSTHPEEKVHFVPLGPNASKIMVEVSKVDGARVWRPNSEVQVIADAGETTVAWPTNRIEFM